MQITRRILYLALNRWGGETAGKESNKDTLY